MQILLIMLIVVLLAFSVLLLALAKQSPREKQTEDKEQEEYIRDYAETVRQTGGSMKKLEHWKVIAIYLIIYDMIAVNFSYFMALLVRFDFRYSSIPTDYFAAWRSFAPIYTIITLAVFGCMHLYNSVWRFASFHELIKITVASVITGVLHIVGITIFWGRMPASYYLIGIMLQFFLTVGRKPCPPGRNLRQRRRDLRPGHGSPGKDRHPCPKPDQAFRLHPGCRH